MILDFTAPFPENSVHKDPSQREAWGSFYYSTILPDYSQQISWRTFFLRGKRKLIQNLISQIGKPYLRSSKLLACWNQLGGIRIETRNSFGSWLGGTWYFPSDSAIYTEVRSNCELLMLGN